MADVWRTAVMGNDSAKLSELVLSAAASPQAALAVVRSCATLLEGAARRDDSPSASAAEAGAAVAPSTSNGQHAEATEGKVLPLLCTLESVQLLHPRGRFNLEFRKSGVTVTGKAATLNVAWDNVRHVIRLPRPEGFNWGRSLDQSDPAGSDLLALPLKEPVPLRKTEAALVLLQPDPKASHDQVSIALDGVSHKVSGSQGTVLAGLLKLLCGVKQSVPDKGLFVSRGGKSFVKCYYGVNEGSLFPLRQGLFFMKPALFLPKGDIEQVVCGRGGSATTRYIDLVVGMEAGEDDKESTREFSNIEREDLPSLQNYIQDALVTPRLREAKKAAKAAAAAPAAPSPPVPVGSETVDLTATPAQRTVTSSSNSSTSKTSPSKADAGVGRDGSAGTGVGASEGAANGVSRAEDEDEEDDGDAESDEDFAPIAGDTDSDDDSGSSASSASGGSDNDDSGSDSDKNGGEDEDEEGNEREEDEDDDQDEDDEEDAGGRGGKGADGNGSHKPAHKRKRLDEEEVGRKESLQLKKKDDADKGGDDTESDEESRKKKPTA